MVHTKLYEYSYLSFLGQRKRALDLFNSSMKDLHFFLFFGWAAKHHFVVINSHKIKIRIVMYCSPLLHTLVYII